jgi:hypothetical protein
MTGAAGGFDTASNTPLEVSPVVLFLTVTVKFPAARMACPDTCVLVPLALMLQDELQPGPLRKIVEFEPLKFEPFSVIVNAWPVIGGFGEVMIWLITGAGGFVTVSGTPLEVSPVVVFFKVTVKFPAARIACPETCVLVPLALMLHRELQPGPLKKTVEFVALKFNPVSVIVKACALIGGLGAVVSPLMLGAGLATVNDRVLEGVPPEPLRTCTVNDPAASTAAPLNCVEVRVSPDTTHEVLVEHPGPKKNTSAFDVS